MQRVAGADLFPGTCILTKTADGPFVDLVRENQYGERVYVAEQTVADMARLIGFWGPEEVKAVEGRLGDEVELRARIKALEEELYAFQRSVRQTLLRGAVETREGVLRLRPVPGQVAVELPDEPADDGGSG